MPRMVSVHSSYVSVRTPTRLRILAFFASNVLEVYVLSDPDISFRTHDYYISILADFHLIVNAPRTGIEPAKSPVRYVTITS